MPRQPLSRHDHTAADQEKHPFIASSLFDVAAAFSASRRGSTQAPRSGILVPQVDWLGGNMRTAAIILGLIFAAIAVVYWVVPASSLPGFFPGFETGSPRVHFKHGIVSAVVAVVLFVIGWYAGRSRA